MAGLKRVIPTSGWPHLANIERIRLFVIQNIFYQEDLILTKDT